MGFWGWNELKRNGNSYVAISGEVHHVEESGGAFLEGDNDWNIDIVPDDQSWWCLTDPEHPTHQNVSYDPAGKPFHVIECEVEPVATVRVPGLPGGVLGLRTKVAFNRFVVPLEKKRVTIGGYWARDRSHGYDGRMSVPPLSDFGDNGKMEIHPIVWLLWYGDDGEFRILVFSDASRQDANRQNMESAIDGGVTGGGHVPHRGESHEVVIEVPNKTGIPGHEAALELEEEIADCDAKNVVVSPVTGNAVFHITTGEAAAGRGFYACHGKLVRRPAQPPVTRHYRFKVNNLKVDIPRSGSLGGILTIKGNDTDYATIGGMVVRGNVVVQDLGVRTVKLGDLGKGAEKGLGLELDAHVPADGALIWLFEVINYGGSTPHFEEKAETAARAILVDGLVPSVLLGVALVSWAPALAALGVAAVTEVIGLLGGLISPNCDGWVVNGNNKLPESTLSQLTRGRPGLEWTWSQHYPGYNSAAGCGESSSYTVDYAIASLNALKVSTDPEPRSIPTGTKATFTVTALDADSGTPVAGEVLVGEAGTAPQKVGVTGEPITAAIPRAYWRRVSMPVPPEPPQPRPRSVEAMLATMAPPPPRPIWVPVQPELFVRVPDGEYPEIAVPVGSLPPHPAALPAR